MGDWLTQCRMYEIHHSRQYGQYGNNQKYHVLLLLLSRNVLPPQTEDHCNKSWVLGQIPLPGRKKITELKNNSGRCHPLSCSDIRHSALDSWTYRLNLLTADFWPKSIFPLFLCILKWNNRMWDVSSPEVCSGEWMRLAFNTN